MNNFKVGDRIRIYGVDKNLLPTSVCATIAGFTKEGLIELSQKDVDACKLELWDFTLPHPKQCRKLKKKVPIRIWISKKDVKEQGWVLEMEVAPERRHEYKEFIEVL